MGESQSNAVVRPTVLAVCIVTIPGEKSDMCDVVAKLALSLQM